MSKFNCRCGYVVSNVSSPSTHEGHLVTDLEGDDGKWDAVCKQIVVDVFNSRQIFECPQCFRIWIQRSLHDPIYLPFKPEGEPLRLAEQQGRYRG